MIVDGKSIAQDLRDMLEATAKGPALSLGILKVQGDAAVDSYVRIKQRFADALGVRIITKEVAPDTTTQDCIAAIEELIPVTNGIVVQLPLPHSIQVEAVLDALPASHDVDGIGPNARVVPPVARAVMEILSRCHKEVLGARATVVGAGRLVGAPVAKELQNAGAHVTVLIEGDSLSPLSDADIVVSGAGKPMLITPNLIKDGVVLIDAGTSELGGKLVGDIDPACANKASVFTPTPGGVGPVAIAMLFENLYILGT